MTDPQHEETFADTERKLREIITTLRAQLAEALEWKRYWSGEMDVVLAGRADETDRAERAEADLDAMAALKRNYAVMKDEAEAEARSLKAAIFGSENYASELKCGNFVEMVQTLHAAQKGGLDRADRAEAALAAQIEADAAIITSRRAEMDAVGDALPSAVDRAVFREIVSLLNVVATAIRNQPHDRTALDRMLAEAREKALRDAADVYRNMDVMGDDGYPAWDYFLAAEHAILALIEKPDAP